MRRTTWVLYKGEFTRFISPTEYSRESIEMLYWDHATGTARANHWTQVLSLYC
jgi:hypothetical protein